MKKAQLITEEGRSKIILAKDFDPARMKGRLICADENCDAELYYRPPHQANGGGFIGGGVFASKSRAEHRQSCTMLKPQPDDDSPKITLKKAIDNDWPIVISLNIPSLSTPFQRATRHGFKQRNTEEAKFYERNRHKYARLSVRNAEELCKALNKIQTLARNLGKDGVLRKVKIIWRGVVLPLSQFLFAAQGNQEIDNDNAGVFLRKLEEGEGKAPHPFLMKFELTQNARDELTTLNLRGNAAVLKHNKKKALLLIHRLDLSNLEDPEKVAEAIRAQPHTWLLMRPSLPEGREKAYQDYLAASPHIPSKHYIVVDWILPGPDTYSSPAKRRLKRHLSAQTGAQILTQAPK